MLPYKLKLSLTGDSALDRQARRPAANQPQQNSAASGDCHITELFFVLISTDNSRKQQECGQIYLPKILMITSILLGSANTL
jgi:hypothetical protein